MVLTVKVPPPSRCRPPPDPPPSKFLSVAFETLDSIIPPEPPDPPDSFFVIVLRLQSLASFFSDSHGVSLRILTQAWDFKSPLSDLAINSISGVASPGPSYLSNKPCEGIVYVPLWNKSFLRKVHFVVCLLKLYLPQCEDVTLSLSLRMRSCLPLYEDDKLPVSPLVPRYKDVLRTSIMLALFHVGSVFWSLGLISPSLSPFPLWLIGKENLNVGYNPINLVSLGYYRLDFSSMELALFPELPPALIGVVTGDMVLKMVLSDAETMISLASFSAILDTDLLAMMAFETLMSLLCEIVWNCQDAKEVSRTLVGSALMVKALNLCSALHKAKEISLLSFHIFSDSQVFISTLRLGCVLNEIAGVLHDGRSLATLFNPLSFSFIPCNVQAVSLAKASLDCMNVENFVI
ncbi:hypothetical protein Bca52824_090103 [Brassica carinata]|uniref:Uncharacterized protein n=1 Tax=Brassica carinata TaxID=52824 RepID=A0A8X7NVV1_BRACI|nr:hypothetical protein Bca52824_090103 [Brassica carinata]